MKHALRPLLGLFTLACWAHLAHAGEKPPVGLGSSFAGPIGLQLYSLRAQFSNNVPATLDLVRSFGLQYVELAGTYSLAPEKFKELLEARGLKAISGHFPFERYRDDIEGIAGRDAARRALRRLRLDLAPGPLRHTQLQRGA